MGVLDARFRRRTDPSEALWRIREHDGRETLTYFANLVPRHSGQPQTAVALCSSDLLFAVSVGAEDAIVWPGGSFAKIRIDVFPDQFAIERHFEEPAEVALADQRVAVG